MRWSSPSNAKVSVVPTGPSIDRILGDSLDTCGLNSLETVVTENAGPYVRCEELNGLDRISTYVSLHTILGSLQSTFPAFASSVCVRPVNPGS